MKSKILTSVIITVIFALLSVTTLFTIVSNIQEINRTKESLKNLNNYIVENNIYDNDLIELYKINNSSVRWTIIDKEGFITYDSFGEIGENHMQREEVKNAFEYGEGYAIRVSKYTKEKMVYYATKLNDGDILRTSIPLKTISYFSGETFIYWIVILIVVLLFSIILSMKLVRAIIEPLEDLEHVTSRIASGDLHMRVKCEGKGEIGSLGKTFNNMADQLQNQINKVVDRQNRLESILSCMESGVIAVNRKGKVIIINPFAKRIFGIRRNITGKKISDYIKDRNFNNFLNNEELNEQEIKLLNPIERELRIKKAHILYDLEKIGKVITVQDITDIKRLENMRSQFVANVSHELKTPLTSIKGFAETLRYVEDDETRKKFLDIINKEAERLSRLINDILVLSKIESESIGEEEEFYPNNEIDDVIRMVEGFAKSKNINLILEQTNLNLLYGDKDRFLQLVLNLVENGIKYSDEGSTVLIKSYSEENYYVLEVQDNGIGIPEEDLPRIFERFYRVDKARKSGGTGLGLAIVKHIVKSFNGDIQVESKLGVGSKFIVKIKYI